MSWRVNSVAKFLVVFVATVLTAVVHIVDDGQVTSNEVVDIVVLALTALGVYVVPNEPPSG